MLLKNFAQTFLEISADDGNSPGELKQKQMAVDNHLVPFFGDYDMEALGVPEVRAYKKMQLAEEYAPKTINNHLIVFARMLAVARDERKLKAPRFPVEHLTVVVDHARFLDEREIKRLVIAAGQEANPVYAPMIMFALNTGMRIGEILALDWKDVDLRRRVITVKASLCRVSGKLKKPKSGRMRDIALNPAAAKVLVDLSHRAGLVFETGYTGAYKGINRIAEAAGLADVGWHTLRHTFASFLVTEGTPLKTVSLIMGHASITMTERYAHLNLEKNKDAVGALTKALGI